MNNNRKKITDTITDLYGHKQADEITASIYKLLAEYKAKLQKPQKDIKYGFSLTERDSILITYADQFKAPQQNPLGTLNKFLSDNLMDVLSGVHILPFFPYSSDDGFAVMDYYQVDETKGTWDDIAALNQNFKLMVDLVANHISSQSAWFQNYLAGDERYKDYFHAVDAETDLSTVVRPRTTPVLTPFDTAEGLKYIWTTFGIDQIDLNYQNPKVLLQMIDVLLFYLSKGATLIRLDAIAFLWKIPGTPSINLPETHAVVKLFRTLLDEVAPEVLLITETNVPHAENISYFGQTCVDAAHTDEAQLVYQFPLAPLIFHTFSKGDANRLTQWAQNLPQLMPGTAFFNFLASHDGIGIRPVEDLLSPVEIQALVNQTLAHKGKVSYKNNLDGSQSAYELNITWFDALNNPAEINQALDVARFLASQTIMLSLAGVPGIYVHSLFGSRNCQNCIEETGRERSINREKFNLMEIQREVENPNSLKSRVFNGYKQLLAIRKQHAAFHPTASQKIFQISAQIFCILRTAENGQRILCVMNVTDEVNVIKMRLRDLEISSPTAWQDLLSADRLPAGEDLIFELQPYQCRWLLAVTER